MTDVSAGAREDELTRMMPAEAYTSDDVLAWERRHLYAGSWTCLGRVDDLFPDERTNQRARAGRRHRLPAGRGTGAGLRMFANTCRHRGHELLPDGETASRRAISLPVPRVDLRPRRGAQGRARLPRRRGLRQRRPRAGRAAGDRLARAGSSGTRCTRWAARRCRRSSAHLGDLGRDPGAVRRGAAGARGPAHLRGRGELEGDRRELPRVLPLPVDPPGAVRGLAAGLRRQLRPARAAGSAARWTCATAWRRCR